MKRNLQVALLTLVMALPMAARSQTVTAFYKREETTGMTKQCIYDALGSMHVLTVSSITLCPLTIQVASSAPTSAPAAATASTARTVTAFFKREETTGMTKQCYYDALGNTYVLTLSSIALCPLNTQVKLP